MTAPAKWAANGLITTAFFITPVAIPSKLAANGLEATFTVSQRLEYNDEAGTTSSDDEGFLSRTNLGFTISSKTRSQTFSLSGNTSLKYNLSNSVSNDRFEFDNPRIRLAYAVESRQTRLSFDASYLSTDVDNTPFTDEITGEDIITGDGRRETFGLTTALVVGREAPTRLNLTHRYQQINFSDTTSANLVDTETNSLDGRLTFRLNDAAEAYVFASWSERDAAGPGTSDRTTSQVGIGGSFDLTPVISATAQLSHQKIETDDNAGNSTSTDGISYRFGLSRDLANGSVSVNFSEEETVNGKRRQLNFGRLYEHKRGSINLSVGVTKTDGLSLAPLVNIAANWELNPRSNLSVNLGQSSSVNNDNETTITSRFGLTYSRELSELSSLSAGLNITDRNIQSAGGEDQTSLRLNLSHTHEITSDWELVSGYTYSKTKRDTLSDRSSSTVFVGLQRAFNFRP